MVEKFRKKPLVVEAIHCTFANRDEWWDDFVEMCEDVGITANFVLGMGPSKITFSNGCHYEGRTLAVLAPIYDGDYLVKGVDGSIYPVREETFEKTYEKVSSEPDFEEVDNIITW